MISSQNNIRSLIFWLVAIIGLVPEIFQYSCISELGLTGVQDKPVSGGVGSPKMAKFVQADVIKFLTLQADYYCFAIKKNRYILRFIYKLAAPLIASLNLEKWAAT